MARGYWGNELLYGACIVGIYLVYGLLCGDGGFAVMAGVLVC